MRARQGCPRAARAAVRPATPAPPSPPPGARPAVPTAASAAPRPGPFPRPAVSCQRRSWPANDRSTWPGPATARAGRSPPPAARAGPRTPPSAALRMAWSVPSPEAPGGSNRPGRSSAALGQGRPDLARTDPGPSLDGAIDRAALGQLPLQFIAFGGQGSDLVRHVPGIGLRLAGRVSIDRPTICRVT